MARGRASAMRSTRGNKLLKRSEEAKFEENVPDSLKDVHDGSKVEDEELSTKDEDLEGEREGVKEQGEEIAGEEVKGKRKEIEELEEGEEREAKVIKRVVVNGGFELGNYTTVDTRMLFRNNTLSIEDNIEYITRSIKHFLKGTYSNTDELKARSKENIKASLKNINKKLGVKIKDKGEIVNLLAIIALSFFPATVLIFNEILRVSKKSETEGIIKIGMMKVAFEDVEFSDNELNKLCNHFDIVPLIGRLELLTIIKDSNFLYMCDTALEDDSHLKEKYDKYTDDDNPESVIEYLLEYIDEEDIVNM